MGNPQTIATPMDRIFFRMRFREKMFSLFSSVDAQNRNPIVAASVVFDRQGPVRESGVELTVRAMRLHPAEPLVLRPSCRTLANLTTTYSILTEQILETGVCSCTSPNKCT